MATGATEFIDITTADAFNPIIWSMETLRARESKTLFLDFVNRRFEPDVMKYGSSIKVGSIGNLATVTKSLSANAATIYETVTETNVTITIGTWTYSAIGIETATDRQVTLDLLSQYQGKMGYALALAIDDVLAGLPDDFSNAVGTLAINLTYEDVLRGVQYLDDADAPQEDRVILISPAQKNGFMTLDHFVNRDYDKLNTDTKATKVESYMGTWMGLPVHFSTNIEGSNSVGHDSTIFQKEALAAVVQMKPSTHTFFDVDQLARKVVSEQLFGSAEMRDDHGVWLKSA